MSYSVVWLPQAEQELARQWLAASNRNSITTAANRIDHSVAHDPRQRGQWLYGTTRVLIVPPLAVVFEVIADDNRMHVLTCWRED